MNSDTAVVIMSCVGMICFTVIVVSKILKDLQDKQQELKKIEETINKLCLCPGYWMMMDGLSSPDRKGETQNDN